MDTPFQNLQLGDKFIIKAVDDQELQFFLLVKMANGMAMILKSGKHLFIPRKTSTLKIII